MLVQREVGQPQIERGRRQQRQARARYCFEQARREMQHVAHASRLFGQRSDELIVARQRADRSALQGWLEQVARYPRQALGVGRQQAVAVEQAGNAQHRSAPVQVGAIVLDAVAHGRRHAGWNQHIGNAAVAFQPAGVELRCGPGRHIGDGRGNPPAAVDLADGDGLAVGRHLGMKQAHLRQRGAPVWQWQQGIRDWFAHVLWYLRFSVQPKSNKPFRWEGLAWCGRRAPGWIRR